MNQYFIQASNNMYLRADPDRIVDLTDKNYEWERWIIESEEDYFYIKSSHGTYLRSEPHGTVNLTSARRKWERWTIEIIDQYLFIKSFHDTYLNIQSDNTLKVASRKEFSSFKIIIYNINIKYIIQSLRTNDRIEYINKNKKIIPDLFIYDAINGYNIEEVRRHFYKLNIKYIKFNHPNTTTYGKLANYMTKVEIMVYQCLYNMPCICLMEDDIILNKTFLEKVNNYVFLLEKYHILQIGTWGEIYLISLQGAKNILKNIRINGITDNIDNTLNGQPHKLLLEDQFKDTWDLKVATNGGDILKTKMISQEDINKFKDYIA